MKNVLLILAGLSMLAGCGGGGNTSTGGTSGFVGVTSQATVTAGNAKALSIDAYTGGQMSSAISGVGKESADTGGPLANLPGLSSDLENRVRDIVSLSVKSTAKTVAATVSETITGFSGTYSYVVNADQVSGAFNGTMTFNQYKGSSTSPVMSGSMAFSGVMNQATGSFDTMDITLSSLTVTSPVRSYTLIGRMTWGNSGTTASLTMSVVLKDNASGKTYWAKDFSYNLVGSALQLTGTYFDPDHGYVVISTIQQLTVTSMYAQPTAGQMLFIGSNGTKARLTFVSSKYANGDGGIIGDLYTIEVDASGNGTFVVVP